MQPAAHNRSDTVDHVVVFSCPFSSGAVGGLTSAILNDCFSAREEFRIFSPDYSARTVGKAKVIPVSSGVPCGDVDVVSRQYLCGAWQLLHPNAYIPPALH